MFTKCFLGFATLFCQLALATVFDNGEVPYPKAGSAPAVEMTGHDVLPYLKWNGTNWQQVRAGRGCSSTPVTIYRLRDRDERWNNTFKGGSSSRWNSSDSGQYAQSTSGGSYVADGYGYGATSARAASGGKWRTTDSGASSDWYFENYKGQTGDHQVDTYTYYPCH